MRLRPSNAAGRTITAVLLLAAACGGDEAPAVSPEADPATATASDAPTGVEVSFDRSACSYEGPDVIAPGPVTFSLSTRPAPADFNLWMLDEGHPYEEFAAHIAEEVERAEQGQPPLGHPAFATLIGETTTDEAGVGTIEVQLEPGDYGMACIRFPEGGRQGAFAGAGPIVVS